ncbi:MAG: purine-nucleoside phosphorylase [Nitrospirae bacterium]|nr:purine-nucleoside phosphorylase [Nitrospirota bacterium]
MYDNNLLHAAVQYVIETGKITPPIGIITGSGWDVTGILDEIIEIPYEKIPGFPCPSVEGHKAKLVTGKYKGSDIVILQGRVHYYEGYDVEEITFPVKVLSGLGVKYLIITNSAGGINPIFKPGDIMVITDHINMMGINPLRSAAGGEGRTIFIDMSEAYDKELINTALEAGGNTDLSVHCGILAAMQGPSYETPAEIQMLRTLGADAVCMSTVPEVIMARYLSMKVLGLSIITNPAAGITDVVLTHEDVIKTAASAGKDACLIIKGVMANISQ